MKAKQPKARQIEWNNLRGIVGGYRRYCIWDCPVGTKLPGGTSCSRYNLTDQL